MKAVVYARFSPDRGAIATGEAKQSNAVQVDACSLLAQARGWSIASVHRDEHLSGKDMDRPGGQGALQAAKAIRDIGHEVTIIAHRVDRISRDAGDLMDLAHTLRDDGIDLCTVDGAIDTATAFGRMMLGFQGLMAQYQRELTVERTQEALRFRQKAGRPAGGNPPFGWRRGLSGLEPVEAEQRTLLALLGAIRGGQAPSEVAEMLNAKGMGRRAGAPWDAYSVKRIVERAKSAPALDIKMKQRIEGALRFDGFKIPLDGPGRPVAELSA